MLPDPAPAIKALLITGTVGVGKTSVADAVGALLADEGIANGVIDLDRLCQFWPTPASDPFNFDLLLRNLRCIAGNYLRVGATRLVLAGVAESRAEREQYQDAVGVELSVCRLRGHLAEVRQRLGRRHGEDRKALHWHLDRSGELDRLLDVARVEDFIVDATDSSVGAAAIAVLRAVDWL